MTKKRQLFYSGWMIAMSLAANFFIETSSTRYMLVPSLFGSVGIIWFIYAGLTALMASEIKKGN